MPIKSTNQDVLLKELQELKIRNKIKLKSLFLLPKVPHERLAKGIELEGLVEIAIQHSGKWEKLELKDCLKRLEEQGIIIKNRLE